MNKSESSSLLHSRCLKAGFACALLAAVMLQAGCSKGDLEVEQPVDQPASSSTVTPESPKAVNLKWAKRDVLGLKKKMMSTEDRLARAESDAERTKQQNLLDELRGGFDKKVPAVRHAVEHLENHPGDLSDTSMDAMMLVLAAGSVAEGEARSLVSGYVPEIEKLLLTEAGIARLAERSGGIENDLYDLETMVFYTGDSHFVDKLFAATTDNRFKDQIVVSGSWNLIRFVNGSQAEREAYRTRNHLYTDYYLSEHGTPEKVASMSDMARRNFWIARGARFHVDNLDIGDTVPELEATDLQGKPVAIADHGNKWRILDFWTTDCGYCKKAMPDKLKLVNKLPKDQFEYISIACDEDPEDVLLYQEEEFSMPWINWHLPAETERGFSWAIRSYPTYFIVSPDGEIMIKSGQFSVIAKAMEGYMSVK